MQAEPRAAPAGRAARRSSSGAPHADLNAGPRAARQQAARRHDHGHASRARPPRDVDRVGDRAAPAARRCANASASQLDDEVLALRAGERAALHRAGLEDERRRSEVERGAERLDRRRGERVARSCWSGMQPSRGWNARSLADSTRRRGRTRSAWSCVPAATGLAIARRRSRGRPARSPARRGPRRRRGGPGTRAGSRPRRRTGTTTHGPGTLMQLGHAVALVRLARLLRRQSARPRARRASGDGEREAERGHTTLRNQRPDRTAPARIKTSAAAVTATVISFQRFSCRSREPRSS